MPLDGQNSFLWNSIMNRDEDEAVHPIDRLHAELGVANNVASPKRQLLNRSVRSNSKQRKTRTVKRDGNSQSLRRPTLQSPIHRRSDQIAVIRYIRQILYAWCIL